VRERSEQELSNRDVASVGARADVFWEGLMQPQMDTNENEWRNGGSILNRLSCGTAFLRRRSESFRVPFSRIFLRARGIAWLAGIIAHCLFTLRA
jgi:hypothetical protein